MNTQPETSDRQLLGLLQREGAVGVSDLAEAVGVTATAIRQRLNRLMGQGFVQREVDRSGRGRPSHRYSLTHKGIRSAGSNYADLAVAVWNEIRSIESVEVRRGLLKRIAAKLADLTKHQVTGTTVAERMENLAAIFVERDIPFEVETSGQLPVLTALACPYPDLAEQDRGVCAMEKMFFSELIGEDLRLTECRLDGASCCTFETN